MIVITERENIKVESKCCSRIPGTRLLIGSCIELTRELHLAAPAMPSEVFRTFLTEQSYKLE